MTDGPTFFGGQAQQSRGLGVIFAALFCGWAIGLYCGYHLYRMTNHAEPKAQPAPEIAEAPNTETETERLARIERAMGPNPEFTSPAESTKPAKPKSSKEPDQIIEEMKKNLPNVGGKLVDENRLELNTRGTEETWWFGPFTAPPNMRDTFKDEPRRVVQVQIKYERSGELTEEDLKKARELWQRSFQGYLVGADLEAGHQALHYGFHSRPKVKSRFGLPPIETTWPGDKYEVYVNFQRSLLLFKLSTKEPGIPDMEPMTDWTPSDR